MFAHLERSVEFAESNCNKLNPSIRTFHFLKFPAIELVYQTQTPEFATTQWLIILILQCVSALLSSNTTLSLPIQAAQVNSLKERGTYCSFWRNFSMLSKRIFQLLCHISLTYITIFLIMESDRFEYFRGYVSGKIGEANLENYGFVIYGSLIFLVFPSLALFESLLAVIILVAGKSRRQVSKVFLRFQRELRIRV